MRRNSTIIAWLITILLAGIILLAGPLVVMTLGGLLMREPGNAVHLLSALILILQLSFAISVALSLRSAWRWLHKGRPLCPSAEGEVAPCYTSLQAIPGAVSVLGDHDGVMDDDLLEAIEQESQPIHSG